MTSRYADRRGRKHVGGFTLLELAACLVLLGLLAALVVVSLEGVRRSATWDDAVGRMQEADASARREAEAFGRPVELVLDMRRDTLVRRSLSPGGRAGERVRRWPLPRGFDLSEARLPQRERATREVAMVIDGDGIGPAYVLTVEGTQGVTRRWLVTGAGQWLELDDDADTDAILSGPDAD